jgi:Tol biopolymer transport system component
VCAFPARLPGQAKCEGRIAFVSTRDGEPGIFAVNADGSGLTRLTSDRGDGQPAWSPDGSRIAFLAMRQADERALEGLSMHRMIYLMDADGGNLRRLTDLPAAVLRWSPDGTLIGIQSSAEDETNRNATGIVSNAIYVMDADGRRQRRLTELTYRNTLASWSPDGRHIAYASDRDNNWEIYVADVDRGREQRLTTRPGPDRSPVWSNIHTLELDTRKTRRLTHTAGNEVPRAWSPDGRQILFVSDDLFLLDHATGRLTRLTHTPRARELGSAFLPGAPKVAFRSDAEGNWDIYVVGIDGTGLVNITRDPADDVLMSVGPCAQR